MRILIFIYFFSFNSHCQSIINENIPIGEIYKNIGSKELPTLHMRMPEFSWETVPVFAHTCNMSGPFNEDALSILAKFPMVTIEKGQSIFSKESLNTEDAITAAAIQIKQRNPSSFMIAYINSVKDWSQYAMHKKFEQMPELWLRNASGLPVLVHGDPDFPQPSEGMHVFDFSQERARKFWLSECLNISTSNGWIDSIFADSASKKIFPNETLAPDVARAYGEGHDKVLRTLQEKLGNQIPVLCNNYYLDGCGASQRESFGADKASILDLMNGVKKGKLVQVHAGDKQDGVDNHCKDGITNSLAAFLIGAGRYSYYGCWEHWFVDETHMDPLTWHEEYSKPLGSPLSDAIKYNDVWERHFSYGTHVMFNITSNVGKIIWGNLPKK